MEHKGKLWPKVIGGFHALDWGTIITVWMCIGLEGKVRLFGGSEEGVAVSPDKIILVGWIVDLFDLATTIVVMQPYTLRVSGRIKSSVVAPHL